MAQKLVEYTITLQITVQHPPLGSGDFGLQDKDERLHPPISANNNTAIFECAVRVKQNEKTGTPNFLGEFAHGTVDERFLYLTLRPTFGSGRRIKVPLKTITWAQVMEAVERENSKLACAVDSARSGTVKLLGAGWAVI